MKGEDYVINPEITIDEAPCQWCGAVENEPCRDGCCAEWWMDYPLETRLEIADEFDDWR